MRTLFAFPLMLAVLSGCQRVGSDPWMGASYTEAGCGTKEAILTTAGCVNPAVTTPKAEVVTVTPHKVTVTTPASDTAVTTNPAGVVDSVDTHVVAPDEINDPNDVSVPTNHDSHR